MPTFDLVRSDIDNLIAELANDMMAMNVMWEAEGIPDVKKFDREINRLIGRLEALRSKAKLYAKLKAKENKIGERPSQG